MMFMLQASSVYTANSKLHTANIPLSHSDSLYMECRYQQQARRPKAKTASRDQDVLFIVVSAD